MVRSWMLAEGLTSLWLRGLVMTVCMILQISGWLFLKQELLWGALEASSQIIRHHHHRHLLNTQSAIYFMNTISKDEQHYHGCTFNYLETGKASKDELAQPGDWVPFWILYPRGLSCFTQTLALPQRINISPQFFFYHSFLHALFLWSQSFLSKASAMIVVNCLYIPNISSLYSCHKF